MKASELWNESKERLVPSATVRKYLEEISWEPSDFELAALLHDQKYASLAEEWETLRSLDTEDKALAAQIENYIQEQERLIQTVIEEEGPYIYSLRINDGPMREGDNAGYYFSSQEALAVGKRLNEPFAIHKYAPPQGSELSDFISEYVDLRFEDFDVDQRRGCVYCAPDGVITDVWNGWPADNRYYCDKRHFVGARVEIPTPFKVGDIVYAEREGITRSYREYGVVTPGRGSESQLVGQGGQRLSWEALNSYGNLAWAFACPKVLELAEPKDMDQATWHYLRAASLLLTGDGSVGRLLLQRHFYKKEKGLSITDTPDYYDRRGGGLCDWVRE